MVQRSVAPGPMRAAEQAREDGEPWPEAGLTTGPWSSSPARPGIRLLQSHRCPDASLGPSSESDPGPGTLQLAPELPPPRVCTRGSGRSGPATAQHRRLGDAAGHGGRLGGEQLALQLQVGVKGLPLRQDPLVPSTVCTRTSPSHVPVPLAGLRPYAHQGGHRSRSQTHPTMPHSHRRPAPLGPLVETGASCSEAVLLGGVIEGQEDVGAQALAEWSRPEPSAGEY